METKTIAAWFIILIMVGSAAGYAVLSTSIFSNVPAPTEQPETPAIVERALTPSEVAAVLQSGKVLIQSAHPSSCSPCAAADGALEQFTRQYSLFVVFEKVLDPQDNSTRLQMVGAGGRILELQPPLTQEGLLESFCAMAPLKPRECLLRDIGKPAPTSETRNASARTE